MEPIHRDDIPLEAMEAFEKYVQEHHPGMKIVCAGDHPMTPEMQERVDAIQAMMDKSLLEGSCVDCGAKMLDFRPEDEDWEGPPEDWAWFSDIRTGAPTGFQCPECNDKEEHDLPGGFGRVDVDYKEGE